MGLALSIAARRALLVTLYDSVWIDKWRWGEISISVSGDRDYKCVVSKMAFSTQSPYHTPPSNER